MSRRASPSLAIVMLFGVGCTAPALYDFSAGDPSSDGGGGSGSGGNSLDPVPTTSAGPATTTTGDAPATSIGGESTGEALSTTGDPLAPPTIVDHQLEPNSLQQPGPIQVSIATAHAEGVRMQVDDGAEVELTLAEANEFRGEIVFYSAVDNGADHEATFTAWRGALESAPVTVPFTIALPVGGSELFWDGDADLGQGVVVALGVTPAHEVIELGTYYPGGQARCYLRRRDLGGAWGPDDFLEVLPDTPCSAIDLAVDPDGALHVLVDRLIEGQFRWWLGRIDVWGHAPDKLGAGVPGDTALALALDPTRVAVCGTTDKPTDVDATAWIFSPNQPGKVLGFDYESGIQLPDSLSETPRDCVFAGDSLVLAGDAFGVHFNEVVARERHFLLEIDLAANQGAWTVASPESGTQSRAQALAVDADGRYITAGYTCADACEPQAELRMFLPGGVQIWQKALDPAIQPPRAVGWSLADSIAYVGARDEGQGVTAFFAEAWFPLFGAPLWSYAHLDAPALHAANALAFGPYGQIYAGGVTAGGYPAFAIIAP